MIALGFSTRGIARQLLDRARESIVSRLVSRALCIVGAHDWRTRRRSESTAWLPHSRFGTYRVERCKVCGCDRCVPLEKA